MHILSLVNGVELQLKGKTGYTGFVIIQKHEHFLVVVIFAPVVSFCRVTDNVTKVWVTKVWFSGVQRYGLDTVKQSSCSDPHVFQGELVSETIEPEGLSMTSTLLISEKHKARHGIHLSGYSV